jgi:hypothetical protein
MIMYNDIYKEWNNFIMSMSNTIDKQVVSEGYYSNDSGEGLGYWNSLMLNALVNEIEKGNLVLNDYSKEDLLMRVKESYADSDRDYSLNEKTKTFINQLMC